MIHTQCHTYNKLLICNMMSKEKTQLVSALTDLVRQDMLDGGFCNWLLSCLTPIWSSDSSNALTCDLVREEILAVGSCNCLFWLFDRSASSPFWSSFDASTALVLDEVLESLDAEFNPQVLACLTHAPASRDSQCTRYIGIRLFSLRIWHGINFNTRYDMHQPLLPNGRVSPCYYSACTTIKSKTITHTLLYRLKGYLLVFSGGKST